MPQEWRVHFLETAQDASRPPSSGKSCADRAFELCPRERDRWVRIAVDPTISRWAVEMGQRLIVWAGGSAPACQCGIYPYGYVKYRWGIVPYTPTGMFPIAGNDTPSGTGTSSARMKSSTR